MCWKRKSHILNDVIHEKETIILDLQNTLEITKSTINQLNNDINNKNNIIDKLKTDTIVCSDKLKELTTDIDDKQLKLQQTQTKYNNMRSSYEDQIMSLKSKIKDLTPSNIVLFYFVGTDYNMDQNSLNNDSLIETIKKKFKEFYDKIFLKVDPSMYDTLEILKNNNKPHKIYYNKKIISTSIGDIKRELNNGKKVILIGENYGGAVVNRILDSFIKQNNKSFNSYLLDKMYSFTFGSYYNPIRTNIPSNLTEYINSNHIQNYIYVNDISSQHIPDRPEHIDHNKWTEYPERLMLWSLDDEKDPWKTHYSYSVIDIVYNYLSSLKLI